MSNGYWYPLAVSTIGDAEIDAAVEVLRSGHTTAGEKVWEFEQAFARHVGTRHAVMVNSGSSADLLMAFASHVKRVILPAVTWPTHAWSWHVAGAALVFVDVDGLNTTHDLVLPAVESGADMVSLVHLMGVPADVGDVGCRVTEDCCEALGAHVGRVGEMATWSFFFSHHITTMEGGMITTDSPVVDIELRSLRSHGWMRHTGKNPYAFHGLGFNVRPTEVAAAIGLVQLSRVEEFNKQRAVNRQEFLDRLEGCDGIQHPVVPDGVTPSWFGLPFFARNRDGLAEYLEANGVETRPILGGNLLNQPAFKRWWRRKLPGAERVDKEGLFLGLHPTDNSDIGTVADLIGRFYR